MQLLWFETRCLCWIQLIIDTFSHILYEFWIVKISWKDICKNNYNLKMVKLQKRFEDIIETLLKKSSLEHETCQLLEIVTINYFPFSTMHFLCHKVMNFLRESWRNYICTIFFPRERLVRTREFCSCYYNFPLLYVLEWSKSRNISTELAKLPYTLSSFFVLFLCLDSTGSANSNWCISDEHFFMIQWHCNQNPMIFGILR